MKRIAWTLAVVLATIALIGSAATPVLASAAPNPIVHYQGVLRDASDNPRNGSFDMIFRFFDASAGGQEILVDSHLAAGTGAVGVAGGLFGTDLGGGTVTDGSGAGTYSSLSQVFRDFSSVFLEISVGGETLSPRVAVVSSAYALNADNLDGKSSVEFIAKAALPQVINGDLAAADVAATSYSFSAASAGNCCVEHGTAGCENPEIEACICASDAFCCQSNWDETCVAEVTTEGCGACTSAAGAKISANAGGVTVIAGDTDTDDLFLIAGNSSDDGLLRIDGDGTFLMSAGNGLFSFLNGAAGVQTASLSAAGDLQIDGDLVLSGGEIVGNVGFSGDLTVSGDDITFGTAGPAVHVNGNGLQLNAGDTDTDDFAVVAGNSVDDGQLRIDGDGAFEMRAGNGLFTFFNGATTLETASLSSSGDLQIDGDVTVSGDTVKFGSPGAKVEASASSVNVVAGDTDTDSISLLAGDGTGDGAIILTGGGDVTIQLGGPTSFFNFDSDAGIAITTIDSSGNLHLDGDAKVSGETITFGSPGAKVEAAATTLTAVAGDADTDALFLEAGNGAGDGSIHLNGGGNVDIRTGGAASLVNFLNDAGTTVATVDASGNVQVNGGLVVGTNTIDNATLNNTSIHTAANLQLEADSSARTMFDKDNTTTATLAVWFHDGVYSNANELMELSEAGALRTRGGVTVAGVPFDLAEAFFMAEPLEAGDLVRVDARRPNAVRKTGTEGDPAVLGVVSTRPGMLLGGAPFDVPTLAEAWGPEIASLFAEKRGELVAVVKQENPALTEGADGADREEGLALERFHELYFAPIALAGRVPVKVDASFGPIEVGDLLAPSSIPGVAMKATKPGPTVGTALEALHEGRGKVLAFVYRGWFGAPARGETSPEDRIDARTGALTSGATDRVAATDGRELSASDAIGGVATSAEMVPFAFPVGVHDPVEAGDVLAADTAHPGQLELARRMADPTVVGIAAGGSHAIWRGRAPLALPGTIVPCKVDASDRAILPGDLLVASAMPGHAMASMDPKPGTVIAKALEPFASGTGTILVLVEPR